MAGKMLSVEPTIDPTAKLHDTKLGAYCEVGAELGVVQFGGWVDGRFDRKHFVSHASFQGR